jgi:hypothetical protein
MANRAVSSLVAFTLLAGCGLAPEDTASLEGDVDAIENLLKQDAAAAHA